MFDVNLLFSNYINTLILMNVLRNTVHNNELLKIQYSSENISFKTSVRRAKQRSLHF